MGASVITGTIPKFAAVLPFLDEQVTKFRLLSRHFAGRCGGWRHLSPVERNVGGLKQ